MKYHELLSKALKEYQSFGLVWRDDLDFNQVAKAFDAKLDPFKHDEYRAASWPGTELEEKIATIKLYKICESSIAILKELNTAFDFLSPSYPEDLFFHDGKRITYGSSSHEKAEWFL